MSNRVVVEELIESINRSIKVASELIKEIQDYIDLLRKEQQESSSRREALVAAFSKQSTKIKRHIDSLTDLMVHCASVDH